MANKTARWQPTATAPVHKHLAWQKEPPVWPSARARKGYIKELTPTTSQRLCQPNRFAAGALANMRMMQQPIHPGRRQDIGR